MNLGGKLGTSIFEAVVAAMTRFGWFRECGDLPRFPLRLMRTVCWSCVRSAILCWIEIWCL